MPGLLEELNIKPGVIYGDDVLKLFQYAKSHGFAIPAINVTSSSTAAAALEAARNAKSPIIIQTSQGGAAYFAGKGLKDSAEKREASVAGAIAAAHYVRYIYMPPPIYNSNPLGFFLDLTYFFLSAVAPHYGVPVVLHTDHCAKKLLPWLDG